MFLIFMCTILIMCTLYVAAAKEYKYESIGYGLGGKWKYGISKGYFTVFVLILVITSTVRYGFIDTYAYKEMFRLSRGDLVYVESGPYGVEAGWLYICYALNYLSSNPKILLFFSALIINVSYAKIIKLYSCDPVLSLMIYFCLSYLDTNNGLRQIVAASITLLAFPLLSKKNISSYFLYGICVVLAMQLHESAFVCLFIAFIVIGKPLNVKTIMALGLGIFFLFIPDIISDYIGELFIDSKYLPYLDSTVNGMSIFRAIATGVIPAVFAVYYIRRCNAFNIKIQRIEAILINMLMVNTMFTIMGLNMQYWARFCFYTSFAPIVLMPKLIYEFFIKKQARRIKNVAIMCYLFYFWYNIYVNVKYGALDQFYIDISWISGGTL